MLRQSRLPVKQICDTVQTSMDTSADPPPPYRLDHQVGFLLRRANQRHLAIFTSQIADVTPTQFAVLAKLAEHAHLSQNSLGRETAMDGATIKGVVDRLSARGLVLVAADPDDRRRARISLSPDGRATYDRLMDQARAITAETLAPLTPVERDRFVALLGKIG